MGRAVKPSKQAEEERARARLAAQERSDAKKALAQTLAEELLRSPQVKKRASGGSKEGEPPG